MEIERVKVRLFGNAKVTNMAAYKRKKLIQRNKIWITMIGVIVVFAGTSIYYKDEISQSMNDQIIYHSGNVLLAPYSFQ